MFSLEISQARKTGGGQGTAYLPPLGGLGGGTPQKVEVATFVDFRFDFIGENAKR